MFGGEILCLIAFQIVKIGRYLSSDLEKPKSPDEGFPPTIFALPAFLDLLGSSLMNIGLTMTHASVYQMLRGSVVVFTGILSILFLGRRLGAHHWAGMVLVMAGAFIVGLSSVLGHAEGSGMQPSNPFLGNLLVVLAQVDPPPHAFISLPPTHNPPTLQTPLHTFPREPPPTPSHPPPPYK